MAQFRTRSGCKRACGYRNNKLLLFSEEELERSEKAIKDAGAHVAVIGNLEFRLTQPNKDGEAINAHVLFDPTLGTAEINQRVSRLKLINTQDPDGERPVYCTPRDISAAGLTIANITVEYRDLRDWLQAQFKRDQYVLVGCPVGYGSFRPQRGEGRGEKIATELDKGCAMMFGGTSERAFFANVHRYAGAVAKPVLQGSDAHRIAEIGTNHSWIKAKATFGGLRQLVYEPTERISLDVDNPEHLYPKPFFSGLHIEGPLLAGQPLEFHSSSIGINRDLVAIIGGRGAGKSVLLDSVLGLLQPERFRATASLEYQPPVFTLDFTKQNDGGCIGITREGPVGPDYLHVRQKELQTIALDPNRLSQEIKSLLPIARNDPIVDVEEEVSALLREKEEMFAWFQEEDEEGNKINTPRYNDQVKRLNEERVNTLTNEKNKLLVTEYNGNRKVAGEAQLLKNRLTAFRNRLATAVGELSDEIATLNVQLEPREKRIPAIDITPQVDALEQFVVAINVYTEKLDVASAELLDKLREQGIEQDPKGLLDKVEGYQREVARANDRIERYKEKKARAESLNKLRENLMEVHFQDVAIDATNIDSAFQLLKEGQKGWKVEQVQLVNELLEGVDIKGAIHFDVEAFYSGMEPYLNMRKFRAAAGVSKRDKMIAKLSVDSLDTFKALISGVAVVLADDDSKISIDRLVRDTEYVSASDALNFMDYLFKPSYQRKYLSVRAGLTYRGKTPKTLSVGQRGTFFLCMKLATDPFGSPFIFDQPEDDLDNEFIVNDLIPIFRKIKKYRQVIIATHNANLVVNADAEQIVIAHNEGEVLRYETGAIEEPHMRDKICVILEGGETAFRQRELKYGLAY
ncbi:ABC-type multidrug transport system ATPase subunit [Paraburkholderia sp. GAS82]